MSGTNMAHLASNVYTITEIDSIYINSSLPLQKVFQCGVTFPDDKPHFVTEIMAVPSHLNLLRLIQSSAVTTLIT